MSKILYVDKIEQSVGYMTVSMDNIRYNLNQIQPAVLPEIAQLFLKNNDPISSFFPVGKYFSFLHLDIDKNAFIMQFVDCYGDDDVFYQLLGQLNKEDTELRTIAILAHKDYKENYEKNQAAFILVEGDAKSLTK